MKMHPDDFRRALEIITSNNRITVSFNTPVKDNYSNTHPILIHYSLNIFSEIPFYELSLYIRYLQMFSFDLNTHEISLF